MMTEEKGEPRPLVSIIDLKYLQRHQVMGWMDGWFRGMGTMGKWEKEKARIGGWGIKRGGEERRLEYEEEEENVKIERKMKRIRRRRKDEGKMRRGKRRVR